MSILPLLMPFLLAADVPPTASIAPVCAEASHDRLVVRAGRDVCGAALDPSGKPRAFGLLPTACPAGAAGYRVDARGRNDLCAINSKGEIHS